MYFISTADLVAAGEGAAAVEEAGAVQQGDGAGGGREAAQRKVGGWVGPRAGSQPGRHSPYYLRRLRGLILSRSDMTCCAWVVSASGMIPMRVLVAVELRKTLRLTRREKKARIFLPPEAVSDFSAFLELLYGAFPVEGFPHTLVARVRGPGAEEGGHEEGEDAAGTREFVLSGPQDLQAAIQASEETGNMIQVGGRWASQQQQQPREW